VKEAGYLSPAIILRAWRSSKQIQNIQEQYSNSFLETQKGLASSGCLCDLSKDIRVTRKVDIVKSKVDTLEDTTKTKDVS